MDIWPISNTMGYNCTCLQQALELFEFNVDAVAYSVARQEIADPLHRRRELANRTLRLQEKLMGRCSRNPYIPIKAAYLSLRHHLEPEANVHNLWRTPPAPEFIPRKALDALRWQLSELKLSLRTPHNARLSVFEGFSAYASLLLDSE